MSAVVKPRVRVPAGSHAVPMAGYLRGVPGSVVGLQAPRPVLRDRADNVRLAWRETNALADDATMNSGWIAGVLDQVIALMIGTELRLSAKPDLSMFGFDEKQTAAWARRAEMRYHIWSSQPYECDAGGRYTMGQIQAAAVRQWFATGEIVAEVPWVPRPGAEAATKISLLPSHWLSQTSDPFNRLFQGIRLDPHSLPVGYVFDTRDATGMMQTRERRARDRFGRPEIVHVFDGGARQVRGITPLAPALKVLRQFDQLADATLTAALIHAIFAATIESDYPTSDVMQALQDEDEVAGSGGELAGAFDAFLAQKVGWHEKVNIDLGRHGKIAHLLAGEHLKLQGSEHPNSTYEAFANFLLREIAACLGVMFEDMTGDFRGATYSSVRMGIAKKWPLMEYRRRHIPGRLATAGYQAWLEEEIDAGRMQLPGGIDAFVANRASITRCDWKGPPKPQADDVKAAKAHEIWSGLGVMTQEMICNDLGVDHEDVQEQLAREKANRERLGLPDPMMGQNGGPPLDDPADPADRPQGDA
ncbi:phage portal protein [Aurantimonas sp. VKM B-3413]|uniref:phage portal protein n=1 Tax=Aurantimonas sp. VKM B-3413 TaxID=2779401 RepID=UPI001E3D8E68|nr:phage portal protein [Aurantimonas sp. VKM B-3413]MCB8835948.1 phage portal protein [Aurantimonas sp. VKM B-3413]